VINDAQLDEQEIEHGSLSSNWSVDFSQLVNGYFSFLSDGLLLLDLIRGLLSDLKGLNKSSILENSGWISVRKLLQETRFETSKSNLELVLLVHQLFFGLLKIWLFDLDNHCQKLVLKTSFSNDEVNNCALSSSLWLVMWINQLCLEIKLESWSNLNIFGSELDSEVSSLLDELLGEKWIKNGINVLTDGLDHESVTVGNGHFDLLKPLLLTELNSNHFSSFSSSDPLLTLQLWINDKWVSVARNNNSGVLKRDSIGWETLSLPNSLISSVGQYFKRINSLSDWDGLLSNIWNPLILP